MILKTLLFSLVVWLVTKLFQLKYAHWKYSHIPGPEREHPIFGNSRQLQRRLAQEGQWGPYWLDLAREYGEIFHCWLMTKPVVFIAQPNAVKEMVTDFKLFSRPQDDRGFFDKRYAFNLNRMGTTRALGYNSILTDTGGPIWRRKKKIMDPAFSIQKLTKHLTKFYETAKLLCDSIESAVESSDGKPIDIFGFVASCTMDGISRSGFSVNRSQMLELRKFDVEDALTATMKKGGSTLAILADPKSREIVFKAEEVMKKIRETGAQIIQDRTSNGKYGRADDILDTIISSNINETTGVLELEESLDDFLTLYAAGNRTTAITITWSLGELTRHPHVMKRLVQEIDTVWVTAGINDDTEPEHIRDVLKKMPYLNAVINEVLRMHPPVQIMSRKCNSGITTCGYSIPSNTTLMSSQFVLQHWEKYWDDPEKFDPERFINSTPKPYTYIPFFLGPRQCIGKNFALLEIKTVLCTLLSTFEFAKSPDTPWKLMSGQAFLCYSKDTSFVIKKR